MNVRRALYPALAALATLATTLSFGWGETTIQPSGQVRKETRTATGFTGIGVSIPGKIELRQGSPESVTVEADDNLLPEIETVVEDGKLRIRFKNRISVSGRSVIRIAVTAPRIESIAIAGSGDVVAGSLEGTSLAVAVSGSGDVRLEKIQVETLKAVISGSGDIRAGGSAAEVETKISGSGDINVGKLDAKRVAVSIAGSGDVEVRASETLSVKIAGSGDVRYHGNPEVKKSVAGSGRVARASPAS